MALEPLTDTVEDDAPADTPVEPPKPLLRGWMHAVAAPIVLIAGVALTWLSPTTELRIASIIYTVTAVVMFGNSAIYHRFYRRVYWRPDVKAVFRRLDHSFIYTFIAGTYTPLAVALLHGASRITLLAVIWVAGVSGLLFRILWLSAPRWLYTALYILMGWAAVWWMPQLWHAGGPVVVALLVAGGVIYTLGAVAYGLKRPNPFPATFGFHEIFHLCTVLAAACHYIAIWLSVLALR